MQFITLIDDTGRKSSLMFDFNKSKMGKGKSLQVIGGLPHCLEFRPADENERNKLVKFLQELTFE